MIIHHAFWGMQGRPLVREFSSHMLAGQLSPRSSASEPALPGPCPTTREATRHRERSLVWQLRSAAAAAKSLQSCPTLCDPIDGSPPGSPVPGILQARTLEWVAISFSNARQRKVKVKSLSRVRLLATPWTAAHQAPPSMGFFRQEYRSGCHCLLQTQI